MLHVQTLDTTTALQWTQVHTLVSRGRFRVLGDPGATSLVLGRTQEAWSLDCRSKYVGPGWTQ